MSYLKLGLGYEVIDSVVQGDIEDIEDIASITGYPYWIEADGSIGDTYIPSSKSFIKKQPYPSWFLDENNEWIPPTIMPKQDKFYYTWDEATTSWVQGDAVIGDGKEPVDENGNPWVYG